MLRTAALKIIRVDYTPQSGALWDVLYRWAPEIIHEGSHISVGEALSALLSRYVDSVIAVDQNDIEDFFSVIASRSRVRETVHALLSAREFRPVSVDGRMLIGNLIEHATQPRFVYTHRWSVGDLVIWDNRCTMHRGRPYDEANHRRDMRRATVQDPGAAEPDFGIGEEAIRVA